jgi:DNA-binding beta-propeller fold protein YncE
VDIVPTSTVDRNNKVTKMKRAINALIADGTMTFQPDGGAPQQQLKYRLAQPHRRDPSKTGFATQYQFALTAPTRTSTAAALHTSTVNASPWQATITNQGDGLAPVSVVVSMTAADLPVLSNITTGQTINLNAVVTPANFLGVWLLSSPTTNIAGSTNGRLGKPRGAAVDSGGNVYVCDWLNNRVQVFNSSGVYQSQFGSAGAGNGQFNGPADIAIDGTGKIWVADAYNNRIQRFSAAGVYETQFGTPGAGNGQFQHPQGIAIDGAGNIFVADTDNNRIQKLTAGTPPTYASQLGTGGTGNGQFVRPKGLLVDSGGTNLWVADSGNNRIQKITNASPPVYVSQFGSNGSADGQFSFPQRIARDSANNLYVVDNGNSRVQKFNSSGVFQSKLGSYGSGPTQFNFPEGIAMLGSGTSPLWVIDSSNNQIKKFQTTGTVDLTFDTSVASLVIGGLNYYSLIDVPSTNWWSLAPGDNLIQITGGASWTLSWRDAWL